MAQGKEAHAGQEANWLGGQLGLDQGFVFSVLAGQL